MNTSFPTTHNFKRMLTKALSIVVILAIAFSVTGSASAQEPVPFLFTNPIDDIVHAYNWPVGTVVTITVDDPSIGSEVDFVDTRTSVASWWSGPPTVALFELKEQFDLKPQDKVTVSGNGVTTYYTISNFTIKTVDMASNVISGLATAGAQVQVCANNILGNCRKVETDLDRNWTAHPEPESFVLQPGAEGWAAEYDADGNQTYNGWRVPAPQVFANPVDNSVGARGMPEGIELTMTIDGGAFSSSAITAPAPYNPNDILANFPMDGFDVQEGQVIDVAGGGVSMTYTVTGYSITSVDLEADTVSGQASPGAQIQICANLPDHCVI